VGVAALVAYDESRLSVDHEEFLVVARRASSFSAMRYNDSNQTVSQTREA
jgi:hypothetical protein